MLLVGGAQLHSFADKHKLDAFETEGLKSAKELRGLKSTGSGYSQPGWCVAFSALLLFNKPRNTS